MNDKVAAAVERLRERFSHVSGQALSYESINVPASDVETILAELDRMASVQYEVVGDIVKTEYGIGVQFNDKFHKVPVGQSIYALKQKEQP